MLALKRVMFEDLGHTDCLSLTPDVLVFILNPLDFGSGSWEKEMSSLYDKVLGLGKYVPWDTYQY